MQQKRFIFRGGLIALFATLVTACGGGGGGGDTSGSPAAAPTQSASINPNVKVVTDAEIVASSTAVAPDGTVQIGVTKTQPLSVGDVVMMAPGVSGFSNGFAGKIVATKETAGNSTLTLKRAGLADVFSKLKINYDSTKNSGTQAGLRVSRVITAPGVKASFVENTAAPLQTGLYSRLCSLVSQAGVTFANTLECNGNKGTLSGKLSLTKDVGVTKTATGEKITAQWEAYFNLEDVKQVLDTNFDDLQSAVTSANENFHFEVSGKAAAGMRLTVPDEKSRFTFNVSDLFGDATGEELFEDLEWKLKYAEVKGLNADDKKGLIPVAGLVIDAACVAESIATGGAAIWKACGFTGALQDSVTFQTVSKPFSFILWAYINVDGELKLTGSFDIVKMEGYEFKKGLNYTHDGGAKLISAEASSPTISMLNVNGAVDAKVTLGSQLAMDVLIAGVRPAAVHIDIYKYTQNYHLEGKGGMQVYPNLLLSGEFCHYGNYEAASQLTVLAKLKASIGNPDWFALESGFEYKLEPKHVWATGTLLEPTCYTTTPLTYTLSRRAQNPNNEKEWQYLLSFPTSYRNFKASVGKWKLKLDGQNTLDITPDENGEVVVNLAADKFYTTELQGFHIFEEKDTALGTAVEALKVKANQAVQTPSTPTLGSNPATPWVGQTIALWLNTTWADIKTVVWNFGVGTADVVVQGVDVILGRSTAVSTVIATPGSQTVTASYRDTFGNLLGRGTFSLLAVTQGTSIVDVTSDSDTKPGLVANNGSTDDATPTISGIISAPLTFGQRVNVYDGNTQFTALAVVNGTTWTFTPPAPLIGGAHSFTAEVAGFDGTPGSRSAAYVVNVQPVQVPVATSCGATIASTPFSENFSSNTLDATKWSVDSTGGSVVQNGKLTVSSNGTNRFPYIQTKANPFPASGDFSFYCKAKYLSIGNNGVGACNAVQNVIIPGAATLTYERGTRFEHWSSGFYTVATNIAALGSVQSLYFFSDPAATTAHDYETCVVGNTVSTYRDGLQIGSATLPAGWVRPTNIFMGNPVIGSSGIAWSSFEVNNIEVRRLTAPQNQGSFQVNANNPLGTAFTVPNGVAACTFNATGNWINSGVTSDANGDPAFPRNITLYLQSAYFFSLIAKSMNGYQFIGTSQEIPVAAGQTLSFMTNEGVSASDFYYDNSGSLLVSYTCH